MTSSSATADTMPWLQEYSQDPSEVGDFDIIARGSSALVERDIQNQAIFAMAQFVNDPEFRIKKDKWFAEWSKSQRLDPTNFQYDDAEWAEIEKNRQAPAPEPQVQAALIRKEAAIDTTRIAETEETRRTFATLAQRREEALMELIADEKLSREEMKARLMDIVTKDRRERDIFAGQKLNSERSTSSSQNAAMPTAPGCLRAPTWPALPAAGLR